jgi:hypothetical protein
MNELFEVEEVKDEKGIVALEAKELSTLEPSKAKQIKEVFEPMVKMLESFESDYNDVVSRDITPATCSMAKRLRLDILKVRTSADKVRKEQKEEYLRAGNAIQGVYNILAYAVTDKENKLKEIETYYERIEAERIEKLAQDREIELDKYEATHEGVDLGNMTESVWNNFIAGVKANYQALKEAERKAEEERIAREKREKEEQERIRKENEKLRLEAAKREKELEEERKKAEAERKAKEEELRLEREERERERRAEEEKLKKEQEERRRIEEDARRKEQERLRREREEKALKEAEEKRKANAPDKEKLVTLYDDIKKLTFSSSEAQDCIASILIKIKSTIDDLMI